MTLAELREKLKAARAKAVTLRAKAAAADATAEDRAVYKEAVTAIEQALDLVKDAEREEALDAESTRSASAAAGGTTVMERTAENDGRSYAQPDTKMTPALEITLMGAASAKSFIAIRGGHVKSPEDVLKEEGYERFVDTLKARAMKNAARRGMAKTNTTLTSQDGGILLPTPNSSTIIDFLRPENTFIASGPRRVPLIGGQYNQPRGASSSTAGYVGEGMKKPVGSPTFNSISMRSRKIAGISMATMEVLKWSLADLAAYMENDLRQTLAQNIDLACYFGSGTFPIPYGILARPGVNKFDALGDGTGSGAHGTVKYFVDPKNPTATELDAFKSAMTLAITDANIQTRQKFAWTMNYHIREYIGNIRGANGQRIYPEIQGQNPHWGDFPVHVTNQFVSSGGSTTDQSTIALVDWSKVLWGDEEDITLRTSTEATIDPGTGTLVHLFQQNMVAILMEAQHDIALEYDQAVSVATGVRWGSRSAS